MPERGPILPDNETYDVSRIQSLLEQLDKDHKKSELLDKGGKNRAKDIFTSGDLGKEIKKEDKVLYVGTGLGHVADHMQDKTGCKMVRIDLADLRHPNAKKEGDNFILANARNLPLADNSMDTICLMDVLHHLENQDEILIEAKRVLKPSGKIVLLEDTLPEKIYPHKRALVEKLTAKMDDSFNQQGKGVNPHNYRSVSEWEIFFQEQGFDLKIEDTKSWHWGVADFLPEVIKPDREDKGSLLRPFESTRFVIRKPREELEGESLEE